MAAGDEEVLVRDARSLSQDAQEALRIRGVRLLEAGHTQVEVAGFCGVNVRQVQRWVARFREGGWKGLEKRRRGRSTEDQIVLSAVQQQRLVRAVASKNPEQLRIPGLLWTRSAVRDLIERECGVRLNVSTVGRYLRRWGFTLKRPVKRPLEADPVVVEAWLADVYPELKKRAARENALILWQDESGIQLRSLLPPAGYAPRGERLVARVSGKRISQNMISALSNGGQLHFSVYEGRFTAKLFIDFLRRLTATYPGRKLFLVCDNHSTHHAKAVSAWVAKHSDRIELHFLPAYSPQPGPDEYLNQDVKRHIRTVYPRPVDKPGLKATLRSFLKSRQRTPRIVANYFQAPLVRYAAA